MLCTLQLYAVDDGMSQSGSVYIHIAMHALRPANVSQKPNIT